MPCNASGALAQWLHADRECGIGRVRLPDVTSKGMLRFKRVPPLGLALGGTGKLIILRYHGNESIVNAIGRLWG